MLKRPDSSNPKSLSYRLRKRRFRRIEALLDELLAGGTDKVRVLDVGGRAAYWKLLDARFGARVQVTLLNLEPAIGKDASLPDFGVELVLAVGDGCAMPEFVDGAFDLVHSNSVIEHVGKFADMLRFANETRRVGRAYYVQTPNLWFPIEPHYGVPGFQWLPETTRVAMHTRLNVGFARRTNFERALWRVDHTRLLSRRMMRALFPDAQHASERLALLAKSLIAYRSAA